MKKTTTFSLLLALVISVTAQDYDRQSMISFEQFREKVSGINIPGFNTRPQFDDELDDELSAVFVQGNDIFLIKTEARRYPPVWMDAPFDFDGKEAEFVVVGNMGMLMIDLPETYTVLTLASTRIKDQATLEKIARETGLMAIAPGSAAWPARIPADYRLAGTLLEAADSDGSDTGYFSGEVRVTLIMSPQLKESLMQMANKYDDEGNFLRFPNGIILNYPFSDIEDMDEMYSEYDEIRFTYYIP